MKWRRIRQEPPPVQNNLPAALKGKQLGGDLEKNITLIKDIFSNVDIVRYREVSASINSNPVRFCLIYTDGIVNSELIDAYLIKPLMGTYKARDSYELLDFLINRVIQLADVKKTHDLQEIEKGISYGESLLLVEGSHEALLLDTKQFTTRSIAEPDSEKILSGPREGFSEALLQNLSLLRRKLRTSDLKMKFYSKGFKSNTQICVTYMDSLVKREILDELYARLARIDIDAILDSNYISELIRDNSWSLFRTTGYTERPDVVAAKLLEGRIAVFVDGTPVVLTVPYLFIENFQSNEDYYLNFYYTSFSRLLRILGFFLAIAFPALYVAIVGFHKEMLPDELLISIAASSRNVPFPAFLEIVIMLIMFDILRETGIRMPTGVGQALSIVGALVVGTAAVDADLVSAPIIIVTAVSGITSLIISKVYSPVILIRLVLLVAAALFGLYGLILGLAVLLIHILSLESFGISQLTQDKPLNYQRVKDSFIRSPWDKMITRPWSLTRNRVRQKAGGGDSQ